MAGLERPLRRNYPCKHKWIILTTEEYEKQVFKMFSKHLAGAESVRGCIKCFTIEGDHDRGSKVAPGGSWVQRPREYGAIQLDEAFKIQYNVRLRKFMRDEKHT